jgi:hypothetical protein
MRTIPTIATGLATAALLTGTALGALAQSPAAPSAAPGAEVPLVGEEWAFFTGKLSFNGQPLPGTPETYEDGGLFVSLGGGWTGQTMQTDDPRMTGRRTELGNTFADALDNNTVAISARLVTIENDDGAWTCPMMDVEVEDVGASQAGWCDGVGAYEGLRAYVAFDVGDPGATAGGSIDVYGFITSGDGPPMPEAPAS